MVLNFSISTVLLAAILAAPNPSTIAPVCSAEIIVVEASSGIR